MSDYETPSIAEQRALSYAKQRAAEQAGAFVESYTRMEKVHVTEDRVSVLVSGAMQVISQNIEKKAMPDGDVRIVANITAEVDTSFIEKSLSSKDEKTSSMDDAYNQIKKAIIREEKETLELKKRIADLKSQRLPTHDLQLEIKVKEQEYLAINKTDESWALWKKGENAEALVLADEAVKLNPKDWFIYFCRGTINVSKKDYNKAISDFNMALTIGPKERAVYINRGIAYEEIGDLDKAISDYEVALGIDPNYADTYVSRGNAFSKKGDTDRAINDYNKAISIEPKHEGAYIGRGNAYQKIGELDRAISDYNTVLTNNPKAKLAYYNRGRAYKKEVR
ncbi:tetratricopeptide repeat protein [Selenomonas ruminantium]|uniref:Tetratricopeptide repeat-containing protein n=1 Tax=Selenomonas ruminantium TaxID=971 RepID=A0A1H3VGX6_SELRU|nr:tetratricopeptide repeat protein [Selenomonas ruminantium]SDZ74067.1 Tetratricopeptide repeat-containing protein [Selenomonas ruminantium]